LDIELIMVRRRSLPWIYRWSRPIIGAIAIIGASLTAYLTYLKLTGEEVVCGVDAASSAGCNDVLNSPYATVLGIPLTVFGFLAYTSMAVFALAPLLVSLDTNKKLRNKLENWTWLLLLAGGTSMATFSGYLMYVLFFDLQSVCYYCIGSATFCLSLLLLTIFGRDWEDIGQIFFTMIAVFMITIIGTLGVYANVNAPLSADGRIPVPQAQGSPQPPKGWPITTTSGESEIALAKHLTSVGVKNYSAFWCPHCYDQKQLFGKEAFAEIDYVECDPNGENPRPQLCQDAGIQGFPSWEINGQLYPGTQPLERLADLSGYQGARDFRYTNSR
jgi:uncharacterized membrane protein